MTDHVRIELEQSIPDPLMDLALRRIRLIVQHAAATRRIQGADPTDPYRGLLLSDQEIDQLLQSLPEDRPQKTPTHQMLRHWQAQMDELQDQLRQMGQPADSRLGRLLHRLGLTPLDRDILTLALLVDLDPRYGRLIAFLQDNVTLTRPTIFLSLCLLCPGQPVRQQARSHFLPHAPLCRHEIIRLLPWGAEPAASLLQRTLHVDERIVHYLLAIEGADEAPWPFLRRFPASQPLAKLLLPQDVHNTLQALVPGLAAGQIRLLLLEGAPGSGQRGIAQALAHELGRPLLELLPGSGSHPPDLLRLALREACLQGGLVFYNEHSSASPTELAALKPLLNIYPAPLVLTRKRFPASSPTPEGIVRVSLPQPNLSLRQQMWEAALSPRPHNGVKPADLARRFRLNEGQIRDAIAWAQGVARRQGRHQLEESDLEEAVHYVTMPTLDHMAHAIVPRYTWADIVLPKDVIAHLKEFTAAIRRRDQVYEEWGFDRRRPLGKGLNALFAGPSGTGKTMAAEIMARELGLALFKIDLSAIVSKYVGETEKHLRRVFAEAERAQAILFFDEADALFGKRSEVRDAHDRYANIEVAYLLQALEEHAGVVILATNLYGNVDDAFIRRMHFIVHFPFPEEALRHGIWQVIFPKRAPLAAEIDFADLARRFRLTGGHIRNIALGAAFLAADDGGVIGMDHLLQAARREFQKMGKVVDEGDFGPGRPPLQP